MANSVGMLTILNPRQVLILMTRNKLKLHSIILIFSLYGGLKILKKVARWPEHAAETIKGYPVPYGRRSMNTNIIELIKPLIDAASNNPRVAGGMVIAGMLIGIAEWLRRKHAKE